MHALAVNSVATLLNYLEEQLQYLKDSSSPSADESTQDEAAVEMNPLFITELLVEPRSLFFSPDLEDFQEGVHEVISHFQEAVLSVHNLVPDIYFQAFTSPIINGKVEDRNVGEGPSLTMMFEDDKHLQHLNEKLKEAVTSAFDSATRFGNTLEPYRQFYQENESLDLEEMKTQEHDVPFFSSSLEKYTTERMLVEKVPDKKPIGMLYLDCTKLKQVLMPSPLKCLDVIHEILPQLAKKRVDRLMEFCQDSQFKLEIVPTATEEFVDSLTFLDEIQEQIEDLESDCTTAKELYNLIENYTVPTPPEDLAVYQTLNNAVSMVRSAIDKALADRDQNLDKFCTRLDKDIALLGKEVKSVKQQAQNPIILDPSSESEKVVGFLGELQEKMDELQKRAFMYKSYQKNFKVEVTKFEELEETHAELKLKQTLWDSSVEWEVNHEDWMNAIFENIDPESLTNQVMKYHKVVLQLEKGLPPNAVVPQLRGKVDKMRHKLPVISDLRNPALKQRHWDTIQQVLEHTFSDEEPLTLGLLENIDAFDHSESIQEISGQASSEASLETLLKKVEDGWKTTEFVVLPHRDSKDVFILGGIDDIQVQLDDSQVNISTIAGSRHVGPIKPRVEEWVRQLSLFSETLERPWIFVLKTSSSASKVVETKTNDIIAMVSPEKEKVPLGKVVLTVSQTMWCRDLTKCLTSDGDRQEELKGAEQTSFQNLNKLAALVRGELPKITRSILCALITIDVHARDIVTGLVEAQIDSVESFEWVKQLRYYWDQDLDNCVVQMSNSQYTYGYEYLGASARLVITPLTMMGRFFSGLAQSGAWCCFDEFNRIDIEVLSVIAQQLLTIRNAKLARVSLRYCLLGKSCAAFITMNPGYAGRTELPDNLKALFRPMAMMVPDYALIAEVILYSEGFESSKNLARKMVQMYRLCSEQLSQQDHYDFGMRAVKSVLVMAGALKRGNPNLSEDVVLIRALRDSNLPKFLADDAVLFRAILSDLFPGREIPDHDYGKLQLTIEDCLLEQKLQVVPAMVKKTIQLYETMLVRHGVMLVGPTGGGKTTCYETLKMTLTSLHAQGIDDPDYLPVHTYVLNPK
ncbi:dynein heavy chain 6, axonemal-like isoform X1, partial [Paramuricea clavata]